MYCFATELLKDKGKIYFTTLLRPLAKFLVDNHMEVYLIDLKNTNKKKPKFYFVNENRMVQRSFKEVKSININYWGKRIPEFNKCYSLMDGCFDFFSLLKWISRDRNVSFVNGLKNMQYNLSKKYLIDYKKALPFIQTTLIKDYDHFLEILLQRKKILAKPLVAERASGVAVFDDKTSFAKLDSYFQKNAKRGIIVQPYLEAFRENGEKKLCFINGNFIFARLEKSNQELVHFDAGTQTSFYTPTEEEIALGEKVHKIFGSPVYFRLDLIHSEGKVLINEIELVNPDWYYEFLEGKQRKETLDKYNREMLYTILKHA